MKNDFTYCTIKYKHCKKQRECKRWLSNYTTDKQNKMLYDGRIWFTDGLVCVNNGYENFKEIEDESVRNIRNIKR